MNLKKTQKFENAQDFLKVFCIAVIHKLAVGEQYICILISF